MSYTDGVNKFFLMWNVNGTTHFEGCKHLVEIVEKAVRVATGPISDRAAFDYKIAQFQMVLDEVVASRDKDDANDRYIEHRRNCGNCQGVDWTNEPYALCAEGKRLKSLTKEQHAD